MIEVPGVEVVSLRANLFITVFRGGRVVQEEAVHNLVVLAGRNLLADILTNNSALRVGWLAVGTGAVAPTTADTALGTEIFRDAMSSALPTASVSGAKTINYFLGTTSANTNTLTEAGLFTRLALGGTMFARATHTGIVKNSTTSINYSWTININAS